MVFLAPELAGSVVRLEPLGLQHARGLAAAAGGAGDLYRMTRVPTTETDAADYITQAVAGRDAGTAAPFAVVRLADEAVIGSSRSGTCSGGRGPTAIRGTAARVPTRARSATRGSRSRPSGPAPTPR